MALSARDEGDPARSVARLRSAYPSLGLVVFGDGDDDTLLVGVLEAGVSALLPWSAPVAEILSALRHAAESPTTFVAHGLAAVMARRRTRLHPLSPRELQILSYLRADTSAQRIAEDIGLSVARVRTYILRIYDKLGSGDRDRAISTAIDLGLL